MISSRTGELSGARKAAIFLMGVGDSVSADVLRQLSPEEVQRISAEIAAIPSVASDQLLTVFREFEMRTSEGRLFAKGGAECAKRLVEHAFGAESAHKLLAGAADRFEQSAGSFLQRTDPQQLAVFVRNEHPQTIAVLMCSLPAKRSAALLASLPPEVQSQVAVRLASLNRVSAEAFRNVSQAIGEKLKNTRPMDRPDGVRALASLLTHVSGEQADTLLARVAEQDEKLAADVRHRMFVFEDVATIGNEGMKALIARLDRKMLTLALKGTSAKVRTHFTQQMSQRASEMLVEDMEALGPVRVGEVKAAQMEIVGVIRKLQQEGVLSVSG